MTQKEYIMLKEPIEIIFLEVINYIVIKYKL